MSLKTKEIASINALTEIIVDEIFQTYLYVRTWII